MYIITDELQQITDKYKIKYFQEILGITDVYARSIINLKKPCSTVLAKAILSVCFNLVISDSKIPELLDKYFTKAKE